MEVDRGTVHVIATSLEGTREALERATALARGISARVVLFSHRMLSDSRSPDDDPGHAEGRALERLADAYAPRPVVLTCVCEHPIEVVQLFQAPGLVVIGGDTRWWWPTAEQRLAGALARLGCHVIFVHVPHGRFISPLIVAAHEQALRAQPHAGGRP